MKHLEYKCECLEGNYLLTVEETAESLTYRVLTDIEKLESREGELDGEDVKKFTELLEKAQINRWEEEYAGEPKIEDAVQWQFACDGYSVKGEESYYPYGHEYLLEALELCDPQISYFS